MADTTNLLSHCYVKIDGVDASEQFMLDLLHMTIESSLHLPDIATLVLHDPTLKWIDEPALTPGKTIEISTKVGQTTKVIFDGEIVELEPDFVPATQQLMVRAFDRLHRLSRGRHVRTFLNVTDGDLVQKIAHEVRLQTQIGPISRVHEYVLQKNETNLDFLRARAAALGYLLFVRGKTLHCEPPSSDGQPVELQWGVTLQEFHPRLTTVEQVEGVTVRGWDPATRQEIVGQAQRGHGSPKIGEARSGGELARDAFNVPTQHLVTDRPVRSQGAADQLAQAVADRAAGRFIEAEGTCSGNPDIIAGSTVAIKALGDRFSGNYYVTSATHTYSASSYSTQISISGHHAQTLFTLVAPPRDREPTTELAIGVVTDNQDPEGQGRVKVKYPWLSTEHTSYWARLVAPGGGPERGIQFLPEVNDEVLVGFELGDVHYAYVLGGLWNGKDAPPKKSDQVVSGGKVQQRIIRSRTGHIVTLDDSDGGGGISIQDKNGNKVVLDSGSNKLTIEVKGEAEIKAQGKLTLESATGEVEIKGLGVKVDGGPATVDVKGSMINLN